MTENEEISLFLHILLALFWLDCAKMVSHHVKCGGTQQDGGLELNV